MIAPSCNESLIVLAARQGLITPCLSQEICEEYSGVLARPKFGFSSEEIDALLSLLREHGEMFTPTPVRGGSPDRTTTNSSPALLRHGPIYLVTGNKRDFREDQITPTKLVSAGELLNIITLDL